MDWSREEENDEPAAFLTFEVGDVVFAVEVGKVREILDPQPMTPIPGAMDVIKGMIDVRGKSITTVDGADVFFVPSSNGEAERLIVFEVGENMNAHDDELLAVLVDRVCAVEAFSDDEIGPAPTQSARHISSSAKRDGRTILILDIIEALGDLLTEPTRPIMFKKHEHAGTEVHGVAL